MTEALIIATLHLKGEKMGKKFDVIQHNLVPKHEVLDKKSKNEILEKYHIKKESLPKILTSDKVIKAIKAKPGDVVKITRKSKVAGKTIYYRLVMEG